MFRQYFRNLVHNVYTKASFCKSGSKLTTFLVRALSNSIFSSSSSSRVRVSRRSTLSRRLFQLSLNSPIVNRSLGVDSPVAASPLVDSIAVSPAVSPVVVSVASPSDVSPLAVSPLVDSPFAVRATSPNDVSPMAVSPIDLGSPSLIALSSVLCRSHFWFEVDEFLSKVQLNCSSSI